MQVERQTRIEIIQQILEQLHLDLRVAPLEKKTAASTAGSWDLHFTRKGIPTDRLMDVYFDAMDTRDERSMFTPTTMMKAWDRMKLAEANAENIKPVENIDCPICKGTGFVTTFDFKSGNDVKVECTYH